MAEGAARSTPQEMDASSSPRPKRGRLNYSVSQCGKMEPHSEKMPMPCEGSTTRELREFLRHSTDNYLKSDTPRSLQSFEGATYINQPLRAHKIEDPDKSEKLLISNAFELLDTCCPGQRVFASAAAGLGKTSFCRYIAATWSCQGSKFSEQFDYAFLIPLGSVHSVSLVDIVCDDLKLMPGTDKQAVEEELKQKRILFVLDSLEALCHEASEIHKLIKRELYPQSSVIVTARSGFQSEVEKQSMPCIRAELHELTEEQVKEYLSSYPGLNENVFSEIENRSWVSFLRQPLNCLLVAGVAASSGLPDTQTALLGLIVQHLMLSYCKTKNLPRFEITSKSPLDVVPADVKDLLKQTGQLCYSALRQKKLDLTIDSDVLSEADVMAIGLFSKGADENSLQCLNPVFQEYLAALFLSADKESTDDMLKEIREDGERASPKSPLVDCLKTKGLDNVVRFLVGLLPDTAKELCGLFVIGQREVAYFDFQCDISYELSLLEECCDDAVKSLIASSLLNAPVKPIKRSDPIHNIRSHLLLQHFDEKQRRLFLRKCYRCVFVAHTIEQTTGKKFNWLDSFVVGAMYLHLYRQEYRGAIQMKTAFVRDCNLPIESLTYRFKAVEELKLEDCVLCDQTDTQFLKSLNLPVPDFSNCQPLDKLQSQKTVWFTRIKGLSLITPSRCGFPGVRKLYVTSCAEVCIEPLSLCFPDASFLAICATKLLTTGVLSQWSSVRELYIYDCGSVELEYLRLVMVQLKELNIELAKVKVALELGGPDQQWKSLTKLRLQYSFLYTDQRKIGEDEAGQYLIKQYPHTSVVFQPYGMLDRVASKATMMEEEDLVKDVTD